MIRQAQLARALSLVHGARPGEQTTLVAIDGPGGAGKSTLADALRDALGDASIVRVDDFYRPMEAQARAVLSPPDGYERYFDWQRLRNEVLTPLSEGRVGRYQRHDWSNDRLEEWREVDPGGVVIVEGVYSTRPEIRDFFAVTIFVDAPREERVRRIRGRGYQELDWVDHWMAAEGWYLESIRPRELADLVVDGS